MSAAQLEVVIGIVHVRVALRTGIWQHALAVSAARRSRPQRAIRTLRRVFLRPDIAEYEFRKIAGERRTMAG
jgi:hypothetical protein